MATTFGETSVKLFFIQRYKQKHMMKNHMPSKKMVFNLVTLNQIKNRPYLREIKTH